jgi:hypothetical protein
MAFNPWMTSQDLIESVKRKISFPISQNTFLELDILAFANEEMFISQVPSVLQFHEEYFVTYTTLPLINNVSRYPIPDRATGMKLRDLFWMDESGNLFDMTRIQEHDKGFFQTNIGANQAIHKFYVEGNDVILTPGVLSAPTGSLVFVFYLRPNQLVKNGRVATIEGFNQTIKINNSLIAPLNTVSITKVTVDYVKTINNAIGSTGQAINTDNIPSIFTAVNTLGGTITAISSYSANMVLVTSTGHQLSTGQVVAITGSNSNPSIDGSFPVTVLDANTFLIQTAISIPGTAGAFTSPNQFLIGVSNTATASNLSSAINASNVIMGSTSVLDTVTLEYTDIYTQITTSNQFGFIIPINTMGIQFTSIPSTYTDQETNVTDTLFINGAIVDFLKTKPGHTTYTYDIIIPPNGITGNSIFFPINSLLVPSGTVNNSASSPGGNSSIQYILAALKPGDYMSLANEAIIPQIPPDLHNGLAERTAARILSALGDQAGLQNSMTKIAEIDQKQGNLLNNRSEGNPQKILNRNSMLNYGKLGTFRRM